MDSITFDKPDNAIGFLAGCIEKNGKQGLGGIEEEVQILARNGKPISCAAFTEFVKTVVDELPEGRMIVAQSHSARTRLEKYGRMLLSIGSIEPEVSATLIEFAHMPRLSSWDIHGQSSQFAVALATAAARNGLVALGAGILPTVAWRDFHAFDAISDLKDGSPWHEWMISGQRLEQCRTVFGTASVHHNLGFNDPERMARYITTSVRLQPTMIALLGNAPLWNGQTMKSGGADLLTHRGHVQLAYGESFGMKGVDYLYPDFLLNPDAKFHDIVLGYMNLPLDRTFVEDAGIKKAMVRCVGDMAFKGMEIDCGKLTMLDCLKGFTYDEGIYYPGIAALDMMLHGPIVDVRPSMIAGPRVETRAHDCVSWRVAVAIDALYRGLDQQLDRVQNLMRGVAGAEIRRQRAEVCWHGLQTPVAHIDDNIRTQQDLVRRVLHIAAEGLCERGKGEEALLAPLHSIAEAGINPAQRMLGVWRACGGHILKFFDEIAYDRNNFGRETGILPPPRPAASTPDALLMTAAE